MLTTDDRTQMRADLAVIRADRAESVAFRRGDTTLGAQTVRIVRLGGSGSRSENQQAGEARGRVLVEGAQDLDIEIGDRFNDSGGQLYRVTFVRPNRSVQTQAEADLVE